MTVDRDEANDDAGGVRLNLNQDAVQEFQVNRSNYTAELGGAGSASIDIVSKSGTNDLHGGLYGSTSCRSRIASRQWLRCANEGTGENGAVARRGMLQPLTAGAATARHAPRWHYLHIQSHVLPALRQKGGSEGTVAGDAGRESTKIFEQQNAY